MFKVYDLEVKHKCFIIVLKNKMLFKFSIAM